MSTTETKNSSRVNITLPPETLRLIDQIAKTGGRSRLINEAVRFYVREVGRAKLRRQLREGAIRRAERDRHLAEEWFALETEAWHEGKR